MYLRFMQEKAKLMCQVLMIAISLVVDDVFITQALEF